MRIDSTQVHGLALPQQDYADLAKALLEGARNEEAKKAAIDQDVDAV
ncbi:MULTISPECIES: hypothetical protein [unclassified Microbacterium]|nr:MULTISPECIES: hypothetical protein [unclassified Microbacterium]|tara:strand:+ start:11220 stop:11360 length:141 start_codon:yes stop_codon:yes gene_type:complete